MEYKRQIKTFLFVLLLEAFCAVSLYGQSNIRVTEDPKQRQQAYLKGNVEVVFVSQENNLFIETSRPSLDNKKAPVKNTAGKWEYVLVLQLQSPKGDFNGRTFTITQSGTTDMAVISKKHFVANNRYYFIVETIKNPIFLVDKTSPTDGHFVNGEACIEINSLVKVSVTTHPDLPCRIENHRAKAGYYSTSVLVDMTKFESISNEIRRQQLVYEDMNGTLLERAENGESVSDKEWSTLETMEQQLEQSYSRFSEISTIKVTSYESNELFINIEDLKAKQKRVYSIETNQRTDPPLNYNRKHWLVMANYAFTMSPQHSFGITVAHVGRFGWYVNLMTNGKFTQPDRTCSEEDALSLGSNSYFWTGEKSTTRWSATVGGILALKEFGYLYAGVGYGTRNLIWYTQSGLPIGIESSCYRGLALDAGVIVNLNEHWPISLGYSGIGLAKYNEIKVGIGYRF